MPDDSAPETLIDDVSGGLATSIPAHKLDKSFSPNLGNVIIDEEKIQQVNGFALVGSTFGLDRIDGIYPFNLEDGAVYFLVTGASKVLETQDFQSWVFVSSGQNPGVLTRCKQIENKMWCSNGVDSVFTWDHISKVILNGQVAGTPNVPKGKYIEYYLDRVWMFNTPSDASAVYFSDVRSTNGVIIAPDNYLAWPADNFRWVGNGDGQVGTAVWKENGQLKFGKERSVYTLFGTNASNFIPRLSNPNVGVASHDSVVMMDNDSHFVGNDGIYRDEVRRSDLIENESDSIIRSGVRTVTNLWESQGDFVRGNQYGTTITASGLVTYMVGVTSPVFTFSANPITLSSSTGGNQFSLVTTTSSQTGLISFTTLPDSYFLGTVKSIGLDYQLFGGGTMTAKITLYNTNTGTSESCVNEIQGLQRTCDFSGNASKVLFSATEIQNNFGLKFEYFSGTAFYVIVGTRDIVLQAGTTGQFISDIATNTSVTAWGNFDSLRNTNGGTIDYFIRSSTSIVNISTQIWKPIVPGVVISEPTQNRFVQWASTINGVPRTNPSNIDNVGISHVEGEGALNRPIGIAWKNRYWTFSSTIPDVSVRYGLIKSKITNKNPDAWMPLFGFPMSALGKNGETALYGGSPSTGAVYRMDFGNNLNESPITSFYETTDVYFDSLFKEKTLLEYYLTAEKGMNSSMNLKLMIDGNDVTTSTISLNGSGLLNRVITNVQGKGKLFRWRIQHSNYDEPFTFHNFAVKYKSTEIRRGIND